MHHLIPFLLLFVFIKCAIAICGCLLKALAPRRYQSDSSIRQSAPPEVRVSTRKPRNQFHQKLARRLRAELKELNGKPYLQFQSKGRQYDAFVENQFGTHSIRVLSTWPNNFRLHVFSGGKKYKEKYPGLEDLEIGSQRFDRRFIIHADSVDDAKRTLNREVQHWILRHAEHAHGRISVQIAGGQIELGGNATRLLSRAQIIAIIKNLVVIHGLMLNASGNMQRSHEPEVVIISAASRDSNCMVCGTQMVTDMVYCRKCNTPHHAECWNYIGQCSTYGCFSRRYVEAAN